MDHGHGAGANNGEEDTKDSGNTRYKDLNHSVTDESTQATWFDPNDSDAKYESNQQKQTLQRLKQIDEENYHVYRNQKLNQFLKSSQPATGKSLERVRRTRVIANEILSPSQTRRAARLVNRIGHSGVLKSYAIEEIAIVLCRLIANESLPQLNSEGYTDEKVAELQLANQERMNARQEQVEHNSPRNRDLAKRDWLTIKKEIKNQLPKLQEAS